ncbi:glucokinase-like ROK family protein [Evansella vedderi]|uniref:Glucokinase-like ROK family protein n=1 Tax=Evansella vedderi TaxID=38282 RepID=A0ABT9ZYH1_9BACI|nr:ROK family protein [Evansella vedderi]MDQ0255894.1 glucokinase-like ROK family protein [Evansella vedderi]
MERGGSFDVNIIVFDIGGTNIKYGVINEAGEILYKSSVATAITAESNDIVRQLLDLGKELKLKWGATGVAISSAGQINSHTGEVIHATDTIPGYRGTNLKQEIESVLNVPVVVENDVNCMAIGEYWKGAAKGKENFLSLALGTGIGGAIVLNGSLHTGASFSAGELGHMTLYPKGKLCTCGDKGCYEMYASSLALEKKARGVLQTDVTLPELFAGAKSGNSVMESVIDEWIEDMALGIKTLVHIFNPELIVIGGGVSAQGSYLLEKLRPSVYGKIMPPFRSLMSIEVAQQGNDANLIGSSFLFFRDLEARHNGDYVESSITCDKK